MVKPAGGTPKSITGTPKSAQSPRSAAGTPKLAISIPKTSGTSKLADGTPKSNARAKSPSKKGGAKLGTTQRDGITPQDSAPQGRVEESPQGADPPSITGRTEDAPEALPPSAAPAAVPVASPAGCAHVRYNHYNREFPVGADGRMQWENIDEEYCISFVFKGDFGKTLTHSSGTTHGFGPDGTCSGIASGEAASLPVLPSLSLRSFTTSVLPSLPSLQASSTCWSSLRMKQPRRGSALPAHNVSTDRKISRARRERARYSRSS